MRQTLTVALGANLIGATLPDGTGAVSVTVDNPTGQWLTVYPGAMTVQPYTVGWCVNFGSPAPSVDVRVSTIGPASQVVTRQGDSVTVTLADADEASDTSVGYPFVDRQGQPEITTAFINTGSLSGLTGFTTITTLLFGSAVKRLRLYDVFVINQAFGVSALRLDQSYGILLQEWTLGGLVRVTILADFLNANRQACAWAPPGGYKDLQPGSELRFFLSCDIEPLAINIQAEVNYGVI